MSQNQLKLVTPGAKLIYRGGYYRETFQKICSLESREVYSLCDIIPLGNLGIEIILIEVVNPMNNRAAKNDSMRREPTINTINFLPLEAFEANQRDDGQFSLRKIIKLPLN